ncbi:hypothetical protein ccbrp13_43580 [Ktedonobacteria bacterium brp13]|nr:hypothetical protein ccbrp13_43580 [Ktedonobacteria bacterium brp13]
MCDARIYRLQGLYQLYGSIALSIRLSFGAARCYSDLVYAAGRAELDGLS